VSDTFSGARDDTVLRGEVSDTDQPALGFMAA
jgi:hypothetical protein